MVHRLCKSKETDSSQLLGKKNITMTSSLASKDSGSIEELIIVRCFTIISPFKKCNLSIVLEGYLCQSVFESEVNV